MSISASRCDAVILAGGNSRRMGCCKALLKIGGTSVLERTWGQLSDFDEVLLSANDLSLGDGLPLRCVPDLWPGCGPLAGLHAALSATEKDALFCVPCDLPNFTGQVARLLLEHIPPEIQAVVCRDGTGKVHPLCGIYRRESLPVLEECLREGQYRVMRFLEMLSWQTFDTAAFLPDNVFLNMNGPEEYQAVLQARGET